MVQRLLLIPMHGSVKERLAFLNLARRLHSQNKLPGVPYEDRVSIGTGPEDDGSIRLLGNDGDVAVIDGSKPKEVMKIEDHPRAFVVFPTYQDKEPVVRNIEAAKKYIKRNKLNRD